MVLLKNFPAPSEGVHHSEPDTKAFIGEEYLGKGTLYISESVLCWLSSDGDGFSLKYPAIFIHAVSKDLSNFPHPCIYLMVDGRLNIGEGANEESQLANAIGSMHVGEGDVEEENTNELRFVPDNDNMLDTIFRAIMDCQALNPDPEQIDEDDDDDDGVVIAPAFNIQVANGALEDFENGDGDEEDEDDMDDEDQFEDAES